MSHGKKAAAQAVLLIAGIAMVCFGVWRGEAETVLSKAIKLCLENTVTSVSEDLCAGILARIRYNTAASKQVKLQHT